jgi:hypothetical protein
MSLLLGSLCIDVCAQTLRQGAERLASAAQNIMKDILMSTLGKNGPYRGLK